MPAPPNTVAHKPHFHRNEAWKQPVRCATAAAGTLASDFEAGDTAGGLTLATGDRILVKDQAAGAENGIYIVAASGAPARAFDMDVAAEVVGALVPVIDGTNAGKLYRCTTLVEPDLGTDDIDFAEIAAGGTPATTVTDETTWGITPAVGSDTEYARQDHTHGSPVQPSGVGELVVVDGTTGPTGVIPSSYVEMTTPRTTTSASLEDITGVTTTITLQRPSEIAVWLNCHVSADGTCDMGLAVSLDGVDHDEMTVHLTTADESNQGIVHRSLAPFAPGTYTVKGRFRRISGGPKVPGVDRADMLVSALTTSGPVLVTTDDETDYVYADLA